MNYVVFDVESIGLHGEGFAYGAVLTDGAGTTIDTFGACCRPENARGDDAGREWVYWNVPADLDLDSCATPAQVRAHFWRRWLAERAKGAVLVADCAWPVEARFLAACVDDDPAARCWEGPYPLHDLASIRLAAGLDPLAVVARLPAELPAHDPLADARQSARLLAVALARIPPVDAGD